MVFNISLFHRNTLIQYVDLLTSGTRIAHYASNGARGTTRQLRVIMMPDYPNSIRYLNNTIDGMEFPMYYDISACEEINGVCIFIYEFDSEGQIRLGQQGILGNLTNDRIYFSELAANQSHYIKMTNIDHFCQLANKFSFARDKRFCPLLCKEDRYFMHTIAMPASATSMPRARF